MKYTDQDYQNILLKLLRISMENQKPTRELIEKMFEEEDFKKSIIRLCEDYLKPEHRKSKLVAKTMDIRALKAMNQICEREELGIIPLDFSGEEKTHYEEGDRIHILFLSSQEEEITRAAMEAGSISGTIPELKRRLADQFSDQLSSNPMLEIPNLTERTYRSMKKEVEQLPASMRFTLFPDRKEDGSINVGFLTQTQPVKVRRGTKMSVEGPYNVPKIASVLLASALLEDHSYDLQYDRKKKEEREQMALLLNAYYENDHPFYLVPATITKNHNLNVFMDRAVYFDFYEDDALSYEDYQSILESQHGINQMWLMMTEEEQERFQNEVILSPQDLEYTKGKKLTWLPPDVEKKDLSERLLDLVNRKRQTLMLASTDFNGKNLSYLSDYIYASVNELMMREDQEFADFSEEQSQNEIELLETLHEKYQLRYAYGDYDKVTELINAERDPVPVRESSKTREEEKEEEEEFELV